MTEANIDKKTRKASDTSIIKLIPSIVEFSRWNDQENLHKTLVDLAERTAQTHPAVHKRIERNLRENMKPTQLRTLPKNLVELATPVVTLDDVVLSDQVRADIQAIVDEHEKAVELAAFDLKPRHKVLLFGEPGNGKTLLAEALASALDFPFVKVKHSGLVDSHLGETGKNIANVMEYAESGPCVLFIDEMDGIAISRSATGDVTEMRRVTNQLLISLDKLPHYCVFVAATNSESLIDKAILRRFDFTVNIRKPGQDLLFKLASKELDPLRTPGIDVSHHAERISKMPIENMSECVMLCQQIRRDLVLNQGHGVDDLLKKAEVKET